MTIAFDIQIEEPAQGAATEPVARRTRSTSVTIAERFLHYVDVFGRGVLLDFERRRLLTVDTSSTTYSDLGAAS